MTVSVTRRADTKYGFLIDVVVDKPDGSKLQFSVTDGTSDFDSKMKIVDVVLTVPEPATSSGFQDFTVTKSIQSFIKTGHSDQRYWSLTYPESRSPAARQLGFFGPIQYGTRTVNGVVEGYVRATITVRNPVGNVYEDTNTAVYYTNTIEWFVRDGEFAIYRNDYFSGLEQYQLVTIGVLVQPTRDLPESDPVPGECYASIHTKLIDETAPSYTTPTATVSTNSSDSVVGANSLDISFPAGSAGSYIEFNIPAGIAAFDRILALNLKSLVDADLDDCMRLYASNGAQRFYLGGPISLIRDLELTDDKKAHVWENIWRKVYRDFAEIPDAERPNINSIGFEITTDSAVAFRINDCWAYNRKGLGFSEIKTDSYKVSNEYPTSFVDANNPNLPPKDQEKEKVDFTKRAGDPISVYISSTTMASSRSLQYFVGAISNYSRARLVGIRNKLFTEPESGVTKVSRMFLNEYNACAVSETDFEARSKIVFGFDIDNFDYVTALYNAVRNEYKAFDIPKNASRTVDDLPPVFDLHRAVQHKPTNAYKNNFWVVNEHVKSFGDIGAGLVRVHKEYKDKYSNLINIFSKNVVTDTGRDLYENTSQILGTNSLKMLTESVIALKEGRNAEIPHYNRKHQTVRDDGFRDDRIFWIYEDDDGNYLLRKTLVNEWPFPDEYYKDILEDGRTYRLTYTYPAHLSSRASVYLSRGEFGIFDEPTLFDYRYQNIKYLIENHDIYAIILAEDTIYYGRCFSQKDLEAYNYWRQNVRSPALPPLADFDREDNSKPASPTNRYISDDQDLWDWQTWMVSRAIAKLRDLCHSRGVFLMLAINVETTVAVKQPTSPVWDPAKLVEWKPGVYYNIDFSKEGARYGIKYSEMLKSCDVLYSWAYGKYAKPFGPVTAMQMFIDWCVANNYQGRIMQGPGAYPRSDPPTPDEAYQQILDCAKAGFPVVYPTGKNFTQFNDDYRSPVRNALEAVGEFTLTGNTLTVYHDRGVYFSKDITGLVVETPSGYPINEIVHVAADMTVKAVYTNYTGTPIDITAGDSLVVKLGVNKSPGKKLLRNQDINGFGPVNYLVRDVCKKAGIPHNDLITSDVKEHFYGITVKNTNELIQSLATLLKIHGLELYESDGKVIVESIYKNANIKTFSDVAGTDEPADDLSQISVGSLDTELPIQYFDVSDLGFNKEDAKNSDEDAPVPEYAIEFVPKTERITGTVFSYISKDQFYNPSSQTQLSDYNVGDNIMEISTNIVFGDDEAATLANKILSHNEFTSFTITVQTNWGKIPIDINDVITINIGEDIIPARVVKYTINDLLCQFNCEKYDRQFVKIISKAQTNTGVVEDSIEKYANISAIAFELPPDVSGIAAISVLPVLTSDGRFDGALVEFSKDGGVTWINAGITNYPAFALKISSANFQKKDQTGVFLSGQFSADSNFGNYNVDNFGSDEAVFNSDTYLKNGGELIKARNLIQANSLSASVEGALRGELGTIKRSRAWNVGDTAYLFHASDAVQIPMNEGEIGKMVLIRVTAINHPIGSRETLTYYYEGEFFKPWPVTHLRGFRRSDGSVRITFERCANAENEWVDGQDVPLNFPFEKYQLDVLDDLNNVLSSYILTDVRELTITATDQTNLFGSIKHPMRIRVKQIGVTVDSDWAYAEV